MEKNKSLLHDILSTDIIAQRNISLQYQRVKLIKNTSASLNIPGYAFVNANSKTQAGGDHSYRSYIHEYARKAN